MKKHIGGSPASDNVMKNMDNCSPNTKYPKPYLGGYIRIKDGKIYHDAFG